MAKTFIASKSWLRRLAETVGRNKKEKKGNFQIKDSVNINYGKK